MCLLQYAAGLQTPQHTEDAWECHMESLGKNIITNVPVCCPLYPWYNLNTFDLVLLVRTFRFLLAAITASVSIDWRQLSAFIQLL